MSTTQQTLCTHLSLMFSLNGITDILSGGKSRSKKKKKLKEPTIPDESKVKKKKQKKKEMKEKSKKKKRKEAKKAAEEGPATGGHKSLMELLELEFRAKAIKALLRTQGVLGMDVDAALAPDESSPKSSFTASHHDLNKNPDGKSKKKSSKEVSVPGSNLKTSTPPTQVLVDEVHITQNFFMLFSLI